MKIRHFRSLSFYIFVAITVVFISKDRFYDYSLVYLHINFRPFTGELLELSKEIESLSQLVYQNGKTQKLSFFVNPTDLIIIVPPYFNFNDLAISGAVNPNQLDWMEYQTIAIETGQIFLVRDKVVIDHQLLSGQITPSPIILTDSSNEIMIYKDILATRPIILSMVNPQYRDNNASY
ncbi:hypothetical protein SAMN02583745_01822 [Thorsellia anophelis DSM 18579]|uniref:Uncharacterized protein n=2 Tax=Thorsellia anophelis TaxID=336804 RepID=A0A1I0D236_9GAMM|nr:hypothetical protein SAMN02583745_01822 [Thorsellia anophelis DSM 18579]